MKEKLFVYGALKDPEIQKSILGRRFNGRHSHIDGWGLYLAENGYLFIKPAANTFVEGVIITINDELLEKTDRWESLSSMSKREKVVAILDNGKKEDVWVYSRRNVNEDYMDDQETAL